MRRPDLLILIAIWQFISAFFCFIGLAAIAVFAIPWSVGPWGGYFDVGAIFGMSVGMFILLVCLGLFVFGGIGILQGKSWGRILSIVNAGLSLISIPIGTVIGILVLIYLTKAEVREYFESNSQL